MAAPHTTTTRPLTRRQAEVLHLLRGFVTEHARMPSIRETITLTGVSSCCSAHRMLTILENKGHIIRPRAGRVIRSETQLAGQPHTPAVWRALNELAAASLQRRDDTATYTARVVAWARWEDAINALLALGWQPQPTQENTP